MINTIDITADEEAEAVWYLQQTAYRVEAELIGFADLPPLMETVADLKQCGETFIGWFEEEELAAALSYTDNGSELEVCRLMVHPACFRRGIGRRLMQEAEARRELGTSRIRVSTGTRNLPALRLYESCGFATEKVREVAPGVELTTLVKPL